MFQHFIRLAGRAGVGLAALTAAVLPVSPLAGVPSALADDCPDAEVVFARGTNEAPGLGRVGDAFVDSLREQTSGLNIRTYGVNYAASKLQLHGGDGANDVISHVKSTVSSCPNTKIVLGGYSQGASVMDIVAGVPIGGISWGSSLPPEYVGNIAAVVTFGDIADRAGGSLPTKSTLLGSKAVDYCNPQDPICHAGGGNEWSGHTEGYVPVYTTQGAAFVAPKIMNGVPHMPGQLPLQLTPQVPGAVPPNPALAPQVPGAPPTPVQQPVVQVHWRTVNKLIVTAAPLPGLGFTRPLPPEAADHVSAVTLFGNPSGRAGGLLTALSPQFGGKILNLCNEGDPICSDGNVWKAHLGYVPGPTNEAANFVAGRL